MKKYLLYLLSSLLFTVTLQSQNRATIIIEVITNNLPDGSTIYIIGNDPKLGNWQPDAVKLIETETGKWSKSFSFTLGKKLEFKITRGSWDKEALNDDGSIPYNYKLEVENDTTVTIYIKLWADQVERKLSPRDADGKGQITGIVRYHINFGGNGIKSRDIIVWLPPFYFIDINKRYPVLYMHDGQNIIDPRTSAFNVDWQIDETADSLIRQGMIQELIIVGIYNTPNRSSEYSENDTGYAYMNFIVNTLKPFIDANYRTEPDRQNTANAGSSLGGLISFMLVWEYSEVFSIAACISPAFKMGRFDFVDNVNSYEEEKKNIKIYIDNGDDELDSELQNGIDEMLKALKLHGYTEGEELYFYKDQNAQHNERAWAKRIWRALIFMFGTEKGRSLL
jgi:predicted alpha/beta superfamily hydrolase